MMWTLGPLLFLLTCAGTNGEDIVNAALNAATYTFPFSGTCGEDPHSSNYTINQGYRQCTIDCTSPLQDYTKKQDLVNSTFVIEGSYTFMADGCNVPVLDNGQYTDAATSNCYFYDIKRTTYTSETHSLWIKPSLNGKQGTITSFGSDAKYLYGINSDHHLVLYSLENEIIHVYDNTYIPDDVWTHLAFQVNNVVQGMGDFSVFINGLFVDPVFSFSVSTTVGSYDNNIDLVFVVDSSASICDRDGQLPQDCPNWNFILSFMNSVVDELTIGENNTRVGVVLFGNKGISKFYLNTHYNKADVMNEISNLPFLEQNTNTSGGIRVAMKEQYISTRGDRDDEENVMILITDGVSTFDHRRTVSDAKAARDGGVKILSVGVTGIVNLNEVKNISSYPQEENVTYWVVNDFDNLQDIVQALVQQTYTMGSTESPGLARKKRNSELLGNASGFFIGFPGAILGLTGDAGSRCQGRRLFCGDSPCFPGVTCTDLDTGAVCGSCPVGYTGDGTKTGCWELNCQGELCFPGVPCVGVEGITCGPCPEGYQGDGTWDGCAMTSCDENSCFNGVECLESDIGMTCGSCPRGYIGDGTRNGCKPQLFVTEPLEIQQCIDIGYSSAIVNVCKQVADFADCEDGIMFGEFESDVVLWDCAQSDAKTQQELQDSVFSGDSSVYSTCQLDSGSRVSLTLFTCAVYLPAMPFPEQLVLPCRSLCEEVVSKCPDLALPLELSCNRYPEWNCMDSTRLNQFTTFHGEMRDYKIYNEILTNREIEVLYDEDVEVLPKVHGLSDCLCPPEHPALSRVYGDTQCVKNYDIDKTTMDMRSYSVPRFQSLSKFYHLPEFAVDGNNDTSWVSTPGLERVSLDIIFDHPVQVFAVSVTLYPRLPESGKDGEPPLQVQLMSAGGYKTVAMVNSSCGANNFSHPYGITCKQRSQSSNQTYYIDLLEGKERWYNDTHTDVVLLSFLHAEGIRLKFSGRISAEYYYLVSDVSVPARVLASSVLCDCYADGTDSEASCDDITGQCPCLPGIGDETAAGLKCEPYVTSVTPNFGPESGLTKVTIQGGYFGDQKVAVQGILGDFRVSLHVDFNDQTQIVAYTPPINATTHPELLADKLIIIVTLGNGHVIESEQTFQYKEDPTITDIFPLESFTQGGIPQTVIGEDLDSVYEPYMHVTLIMYEKKIYGNPNYTLCTVLSNTMMTCPTPSFESVQDLPRRKRDVAENHEHYLSESANIEDIAHERHRRQSVPTTALNQDGIRQFYISFYLDGVPTYRNVTEALGEEKGIIYVFRDPVIEEFDKEVLIFRPYKGDKLLELGGQKMDSGCQLKDYEVQIGEGMCENRELFTNLLQCAPPTTPPALGEYAKDGAHRVLCQVGNIRLQLGYMEYRTGYLDEPWFVAVIVVVVLVVAILVISLIIYFIMWRHYGESPYQRLKKRRENRRKNMYVMGPDGTQETLPLQPRQVNLMMELKKSEPVLHDNVMKCHIDPERMELGKRIGKGNFGMVHEAMYNSPQGRIKVAVKTLKGGSDTLQEMTNFLEEATIMQDFDHKNVLTLHGVVIKDNTPYVLLPLMDKGDMKNYVADANNQFSVGELIGYGCQIAEGMAYLAGLKFVHRDLAARNCMINSDKLLKIADFGLARDIYEKDYYAVQDKKKPLPVKWMAVECLDNFKFSTKSDVWSYGITLWELLMRGVKPYSHVDNIDMKRYLLSGRRLEKPAYCPDQVYELMFECWLSDPEERPTFSAIKTRLDRFLNMASEFESNPIYDGTPEQAEQTKERPNDYLEMMGMAPGVTPETSGSGADDTYQGYLQLVTAVPSEMPSSSMLNNNQQVPMFGGATGEAIGANRPSDRYSKDPTVLGLSSSKQPDHLNSSDGYMDPASVAVQYEGLSKRPMENPQYTDLKGVKQPAPTSPTSPGYLQPVQFKTPNEKAATTGSDSTGYLSPSGSTQRP